jgi:prophage tail gpP-like protein
MPKYKGEEHRPEATEFPVPGRYYIIQKSDSAKGLSGISAKAYGDGKRWREIWKPNKKIARSSDPNKSFWPLDVIWIPGDPPAEEPIEEAHEDIAADLVDTDPNGIVIIIDGVEIAVVSATVLITFDTAADGWAATVEWNPEDVEQSTLLKPFGYQEAACYVGGKLMVRGYLYNIAPSFGPGGREKRLEGWSFTADVIDSTLRPPYERSKVTLEQRAIEIVNPLGVGVEWKAGDDKQFDRVTAQQDGTILDHLSKLAKQRGVQISSTPQGRLLFHKAEPSLPVASFVEGDPPFTEGAASYSGRDRFATYIARAQSPGKNNANATALDGAVPAQRMLSFTAEESDAEDLQKAADWRRSKQLGDSMTLDLPVNSWYDPFGDLWTPGSLVTVISPSLDLPNGFDFLIQKVEFILADNGSTAIHTLVPPQIYTGEPLPDPWAEEPEVIPFGEEE